MRRFFAGVTLTAVGLLLIGCATTRLPTSEEAVIVERTYLKKTAFDSEQTEVFLFRPKGKGPFPGIVLIHGDQPEQTGMPGGKAYFYDGTGEFLASRGYAVMAPSMPGFGDSTGERDFVGSATIARLHSAIRHFQKLPHVDSRRIAMFGESRGATAAALLARTIPEIRGLILQSGLYDLRDVAKERKPGKEMAKEALEMKRQIIQEAGSSAKEMLRRSPAAFSKELSCPILLIHGTEDKAVSIDQMRRFAETLRKEMGQQREVVALEVPAAGHVVSGAVVWSEALPFLERCLGGAGLVKEEASGRNKAKAAEKK